MDLVTKASSKISFPFSPNLFPTVRLLLRCVFFESLPQSLLLGPPPIFSFFLPHSQPRQRQTGRISVPPPAPFVAGMLHRTPLATLDPQSAHSRLAEDMTNSTSPRLPADPKDAAANRYGRHFAPRRSIGDEGVPIHSASSSRKNSLVQ